MPREAEAAYRVEGLTYELRGGVYDSFGEEAFRTLRKPSTELRRAAIACDAHQDTSAVR